MRQYENHNLENNELPFIYKPGKVRSVNRMFAASNWHENVEILYFTEGRGVLFDNGRVMSVVKGDVAVINANHLHALAGDGEPLCYRYLIVDRAFCLANGFDSTALSYQPKINDPALLALMSDLNAAYEMPDGSAYKTLTARTLVLRIMLLLCTGYSQSAAVDDRRERSTAYVKKAIDYIRASYANDLSLDEVAAFAGINKCYLSREFHKYTGYPFVAYVNRTRCQQAARLLLDGHLSVHEIGKLCGFENRSYFTKSFRRYMGSTPNEYRASVANQAEERKPK
ncbi:MAG: AraC family transcriptional regulator [Ruminococcaceae bacterium]|nr:AraC family transcriptional regulator [Oscillospiraceae bacterium]